jgi:hypothetical protein
LNPRAAINDLLPFQGSPFGQLGYFSRLNGEDGIRTHAPFRTNGFQDRLVMTTSIPLHMIAISCSTPAHARCLITRVATSDILPYLPFYVNAFFIFFAKFFDKFLTCVFLRKLPSLRHIVEYQQAHTEGTPSRSPHYKKQGSGRHSPGWLLAGINFSDYRCRR